MPSRSGHLHRLRGASALERELHAGASFKAQLCCARCGQDHIVYAEHRTGVAARKRAASRLTCSRRAGACSMLSTRSHAAGVPPCSAWYTDAHRTRYPCYHYSHFFARARSLDCFKISRSIQSVSAQSSKFRLSDWYRCDNVMDAASHWYRCDNVMDAAFAVMHRRHRLHAGQGPNHPRSPVCSARRRGCPCRSRSNESVGTQR